MLSKVLFCFEDKRSDLDKDYLFVDNLIITRVLGKQPFLKSQGDHSLLYFAYTCVRDLFIGGLFTLQKRL
jgi:hypothetical protein